MMAMSIEYLADHPAMLEPLAEAFRTESPVYFEGRSTDSIIETLLAPTLQDEARRLGIATLYAGSGRAAALFRRLDWQVIETLDYHDEHISIQRRDVGQ